MTLSSAVSPPLSAMRAISHDCWALCETGPEPVDFGSSPPPNKISCIHESSTSANVYEVKLERPIASKQWTTIRYVPGTTKISYASLPGNINNDNYVNSTDIIWRADCLSGNIPSHCGSTIYTQDMDHSGGFAIGSDYNITWIDLWNGAGRFIPWQQQSLPANTCAGGGGGGICPVAPCGPDPGPQMAMSGGGGVGIESQSMSLGMGGEGGEESLGAEMLVNELVEPEPTLTEQNAVFADWTVNFLVDANPQGSEALDIFDMSLGMITQWCLEQFSTEEKSLLVQRLTDPGLIFAGQAGADAAAGVVAALTP